MDDSRRTPLQSQVPDSASFLADNRLLPSRELSRDELRALVRNWTVTLRAEGMLPEQALILVKERVRERVLQSASYVGADDTKERRDLALTDASRFCIEAYFDDRVTVSGTACDEPEDAHRTAGQPS